MGPGRRLRKDRGRSLVKERRHREELALHVREREGVGARADDDHHVDAGGEEALVEAKRLAEQPLGAVALHGAPDLSRGDDTETGRGALGPAGEEEEQVPRGDALPAVLDAYEVTATADALVAREAARYFCQVVTASRLRPLRRRLLMTLRPPAVAMRARKPCVRARRVLWGWYVRFMRARREAHGFGPVKTSR